MNQGKIWLVVKPTVGLPLFLGGVTVIALSVHAAILTHTDWYPGYYNGGHKAKAAAAAAAAATTDTTAVAVVAPAADNSAPGSKPATVKK
jgi:light-harvesting protein B-800-850 alpha chain